MSGKQTFRIITRKCSLRRGTLFLIALALLNLLTGCADLMTGAAGTDTEETAQTAESVTRQSFYFDTICSVTVYGMDERTYRAAAQEDAAELTFSDAASDVITEVFSLCSEYEQLLSKTVEGSDIWNINHAGGGAVSCDVRTIELVQKGIGYGELSGGRFDITVGLATDLWDFDSAQEGQLPDEEELAEAVSHVDYTQIVVDEEALTIRLADAEAELDLGGIAKGYIADAVCVRLKELGVTSAIVSLGGNIACVGGKPKTPGFVDAEDDAEDSPALVEEDMSPFTIGIETPYSDKSEIVGYSGLTDGTMVTSGVYERYFTIDGVEYHHILDVETGYPVETDVLGVTILGAAGTSADADALSTICLILGSSEGLSLIEGLDDFEAAFILRDNSMITTSGMDFTEIEG